MREILQGIINFVLLLNLVIVSAPYSPVETEAASKQLSSGGY